MATIRLVVGLLCITHPLVPVVGVSFAVFVIGVGLIVSGFFADIGDDEAYDLDLSR